MIQEGKERRGIITISARGVIMLVDSLEWSWAPLANAYLTSDGLQLRLSMFNCVTPLVASSLYTKHSEKELFAE